MALVPTQQVLVLAFLVIQLDRLLCPPGNDRIRARELASGLARILRVRGSVERQPGTPPMTVRPLVRTFPKQAEVPPQGREGDPK
jgi:hypothetical protein